MSEQSRIGTTPRAIEFFAGIGGFSAATEPHVDVRAAFDLSSHTLSVLARNFPNVPTVQRNIEQLSARDFEAFDASLWWMSPPCQPYTVRGHQRDLDDRRAKAFLHMLTLIERCEPPHLAMENVQGFFTSVARERILEVLATKGYEVWEGIVCPTSLGIPAKRERYYLVASKELLIEGEDTLSKSALHDVHPERELADYLDDQEEVDESLYVSPAQRERFAHAMRIFDRDAKGARLNCFTSAYGKTFRYSGAYVREPDNRVRFFSSKELTRLLGFPEGFDFPEEMTRKQRYRYVGNSLSIPAVRHVLRRLPVMCR